MRELSILVLMAAFALPVSAAKRATVEQLEKVLAAAYGKRDAKVAQQLNNLELTERLSAARLSRWEPELPGPESRRSLVALADVSAFLDPPAVEIPAAATPDSAMQRRIMAMTVDYATKTIRELPNFFATRETIQFEDSPVGQRADSSVIPYVPMHAVGKFSDTVLYRDGREVVDSGVAKGKKQGSAAEGLTTSGVFGPILGTVLVDAAHGELVWSHWEQGTAGLLAVFRFAIPRKKSHYEVKFCCIAGDSGDGIFQQFSGYHGEIAVDPVNGAILRLTLKADLKPTDPLGRSDILVEYGPVEIGGKTYTCPVKSVSITLAPRPSSAMQRYRGELLDNDTWAAREHLQTMLNDVVFEQYHMFRSDARILTGNNTGQASDTAVPIPAGAAPAFLNATTGKQDESPRAESNTPTAAKESSASAAPAAEEAAAAPAPTTAPAPVVPEISVAETATVPVAPAIPMPLSTETGMTLRVTTRLVDVDVVALDKKGHPITDLKPEDFEIYDNGRKQAVQYFSQAGGVSAAESADAPGQARTPANEIVYSNRRADLAGTKPRTGATESSVTILLIDASSLAWADLTYARVEMLRALQKLPSNERVGLYAQSGHGFQVLLEATADHALLASRLRQWMPRAQDLAQAQEEEQRNRQQFDEVLHQDDLQNVNGNMNTPAVTTTMVDPVLRNFGSNPERDALSILVGVARHLAAIAGHKNLVWVASDNVLANWGDKAAGTDKGSQHMRSFVLRAQEALNDAQVSVYPLDASQLETMAIDPSLRNRNIELSPSVTVMPSQGPDNSAELPSMGTGAASGRNAAEMQQDIHPIQGAIQDVAQATGGRVFGRSGNLSANIKSVVEDGSATYLLGFAPDAPADNQYHLLTVKVARRRGVTLRYRSGYFYLKDPVSLKERFIQAIWQPLDASDIGVRVHAAPAYTGVALMLNIETNDLALKLQGERWMDKLDIFVVHTGDDGLQARITERTLALALQPATYEALMEKGIPFDQFVERTQDAGPIRIVVVDENSGRMGSVTLPAAILQGNS